MLYRVSLLFLCSILVFSCQKQTKQSESTSPINKEKIDAVFRKALPKVLLDHLYVVVDSITYAKLTTDNQLKKTYASLDLGLPNFAPINNHATTCFLRGYQHYIEILGPNNKYNEPIGKSGIGFSLKDNDKHFHLGEQPELKIENDSFLYANETVKMPFGDHQHTWFKAFYTPSPGTSLHTWYGYYNPAFLDSLYGKHYPSYSREAFLQNTYENQKLFHGIKEIYLSCTPDDYSRIAQELRYLRCKLLENKDNVLTIAGGDVTIHIEPSNTAAYSRITKIICQLNTEDDSNTELGNLIITNQGTESIWNLTKLYKNNP
ncbi:DUF5829 family protein [Aquimarina sp. RZ0]|uniref:DUF5829 family protein n=1 Tax=Aquimarina sp. RZ0 TaxID=2607730 RepID=UPI0011F15E5A|nr:DUF5829 family protein [Aquimarina sp. RZ0]KAA1247903.1 hypothetical protein F0000_01405 [Aquimarina sp. RZ0]